jgi:hypothetical protein
MFKDGARIVCFTAQMIASLVVRRHPTPRWSSPSHGRRHQRKCGSTGSCITIVIVADMIQDLMSFRFSFRPQNKMLSD